MIEELSMAGEYCLNRLGKRERGGEKGNERKRGETICTHVQLDILVHAQSYSVLYMYCWFKVCNLEILKFFLAIS